MNQQVDPKQLRIFGLTVGGIFAFIGLWPTLLRGEHIRFWPVVVATVLVLSALALPWSLDPVYRVWMRIGHVLGEINSKIILGILFYGLITPLGMIRRLLLGKDALHRKFEPKAETYRIVRQPRPKSHLKQQF